VLSDPAVRMDATPGKTASCGDVMMGAKRSKHTVLEGVFSAAKKPIAAERGRRCTLFTRAKA
jgi:hypothetical protein